MAASVTYTTVNGQIIQEDRGGVESFYVPDPLGNTAALVNTAGAQTDSWTYWPYGEVQSHSGSSTSPFLFVGTDGYFTTAPNAVYVRARFLSTCLTSWLTTDPEWPATFQYSYADRAPGLFTDPGGRQTAVPLPAPPGVFGGASAGAEGGGFLFGEFAGPAAMCAGAVIGATVRNYYRSKWCVDTHDEYKRECAGANACKGILRGDCRKFYVQVDKIIKCILLRFDVFENCDFQRVPGWTPNPGMHAGEICGFVGNLCQCLKKSPGCWAGTNMFQYCADLSEWCRHAPTND